MPMAEPGTGMAVAAALGMDAPGEAHAGEKVQGSVDRYLTYAGRMLRSTLPDLGRTGEAIILQDACNTLCAPNDSDCQVSLPISSA